MIQTLENKRGSSEDSELVELIEAFLVFSFLGEAAVVGDSWCFTTSSPT